MTTTVTERKYEEMSVADLQARAAELRHDFTELSEGTRNDDHSQRVRAIVDEVNILDTHLTLALAKERTAAQGLWTPPAAATGAHGPTGGYRSIGEVITEAPAWVDFVESGLRGNGDGSAIGFVVDGGIDGVRTLTEWTSSGPTNATASAVNTLLPVGQPIPPVPREAALFMRDLIPVQGTTLQQVPYVRELTPTLSELGASAVAEAGTKPDVSLSFQAAVASVTVIAANISPSKQLWADAPLVVAYINQRLPYLVKFKEDAEILNGSGTWPDIEGLRQGTGVQSNAATSGEYAISIGSAIAKVENVDGVCTAVVMNPTDAWAMFTKRASGGSGTFDAGTPFSNIPMTVWGLPVKRSRVYPQGEALVGDYARAAMILDREQMNVQVYPQHSTYAAQNLILVQCEERIGLMKPRPDLLVKQALA